MLNPLLKVAQYMYFQEKLGEYNSISYSGMLPHKNKVDNIIMFSMVLIKNFISVSYFIFNKKDICRICQTLFSTHKTFFQFPISKLKKTFKKNYKKLKLWFVSFWYVFGNSYILNFYTIIEIKIKTIVHNFRFIRMNSCFLY